MLWPAIILFEASFVGGILIGMVYRKNQSNKILEKLRDIFTNTDFRIISSKEKAYDFIIESKSKLFLIKVVYANYRNEIVMANAKRWYLNALRDSTKASKNIRVMNEIEALVTYDNDTNKDLSKLFLIYTGAGKIVKYINESELVFVTPKIDCWGYKVINYDDINVYFDEFLRREEH